MPRQTGNPLLDPHSIDDIRRRYAQCYFRAFIANNPVVVLVREVYDDNDDIGIILDIIGPSGIEDRYEGSINNIILDLTMPNLGVINTDNYGAIYVDKVVKRQWLRGLCSNVVHITSYERVLEFDPHIALSILKNKYISKEEAVDRLVRGEGCSYGINKDVALVVSHDRSDISVYHAIDEVGHVCLLTGDIVLVKPFEPLIEYLSTMSIGNIIMGEV